MHNRKVFVYKDLNYAASKTSTTVNTALNPADLRDGAIGVYGTHRSGATNLNKLVLITDGGSEVAGAVPMATFVGDQIFIAMGTANGNTQISNYIDKPGPYNGLRMAVAKKYTAPVLGVQAIGYNGTAGSSMNLPATILAGDDFSIKMIDRNSIVSGFRSPYMAKTVSVGASVGDTGYTLAKKWIAALNTYPDSQIPVDKVKARILAMELVLYLLLPLRLLLLMVLLLLLPLLLTVLLLVIMFHLVVTFIRLLLVLQVLLLFLIDHIKVQLVL